MSSSRIRFVDLQRQYQNIRESIDRAINDVVASGRYAGGEKVSQFEREFSGYIGTKYGYGVGSGSDALIMALQSLGITKGDEVITVPFTFVSTADAILHVSARPVFVDIDKETLTIDVNQLKSALIKHRGVKAIIPVHLYGTPAEMDQIMEIAEDFGVYVIEDAAQAHGASFGGRKIGTFGDISCFSFYPSKNLGAYGDGGFIATNSQLVSERVRLLREYGQVEKYRHDILGWNSRLDPIQATVLSAKLKYLDDWNSRRAAIANIYRERLSNIKNVKFQAVRENSMSVYHIFAIFTDRRDELKAHLEHAGIETGVHYPIPVHKQKYYSAVLSKGEDRFTYSENAANTELSMPMFPEMREDEIDSVTKALFSYYNM